MKKLSVTINSGLMELSSYSNEVRIENIRIEEIIRYNLPKEIQVSKPYIVNAKIEIEIIESGIHVDSEGYENKEGITNGEG